MFNRIVWVGCLLLFGLSLFGCESVGYTNDSDKSDYPVLTAVGYAPISQQPALLEKEKVLQAMEASKILAYRELAEQVYGMQLSSSSAAKGYFLNSIDTKVKIQGVIKGAKVVKTYPVDGFYVTELELDFKLVRDLYMQSESPVQSNTLIVEPVKNF
ncbi:LPP20 family lipoprotein [Shewanella maritima]|uniref:LPP20 family lipoprotein n=1 Tax=Shewanella maritima TaxID=2520507 RepID=UPI001F5EBE6D|nr:flagellar biosynthesis protein FlgP [Shewanella maritima]